MRFPFLGGFSTASPCPKNPLGSGKGWSSLQSPHPSPILCHTDVLASAALSQISMLWGAQSRQGAGRQDISRWKTIGKTPNPFSEQGKGPRSLLLPQCCAFGV